MPDHPSTEYARTADGVHIGYQVVGDGPHDVMLVEGLVSHLEAGYSDPWRRAFYDRLTPFSRLILFDKRGVGVSDRVAYAVTLEQRVDDMVAVLDAVGSDKPVLLGISEGAPASLLFAATHPKRVQALALWGGMARSTWAPDYPWAAPAEDLIESGLLLSDGLLRGDDIDIWMPSLADNEEAKAAMGSYRRSATTPGSLQQLFLTFLEIDVRAILPTISVPTLVLHRRGDRVVNWRAAKWMAEQIEGARYCELPGQDHFPWVGDMEAAADEIEEFVTGTRHVQEPERVLSTVLFTDIVGSTERASEVGDRAWRKVLDDHDAVVAKMLERYRGKAVKSTGDGLLALFDGPARAIRFAMELPSALTPLGIEIRTGLHTGEVELRGDDVSGIAVHLAARVQAAANPGEVLVSRTVTDLVAGSGIQFADRGEHELKGIPGTWLLLAVTSA